MARRRSRRSLLESGLAACALGVAMLLAPMFLSGRPLLNSVAAGLRTPGQIALAAGALLVAIHFLVRFFVTRGQAASPAGRGRLRAASRGAPAATRPITPSSTRPIDRVMAAQASWTPRRGELRDPSLAADPADRTPRPPTQWSREVFGVIEWRRFEAVCEKLFAQAGFEARSHPVGADGGVDIWLYFTHGADPVAIVQCKHWHDKPVPVKAMREFLGVMAAHNIARGTYAASSTFTPDALAFARANGINAQDGDGLLRLIARRTPQQQAELLAIALEGDYWCPTCPSCNVKMVERTARKTGQAFWGCPHYPRCKFRLPLGAAGRQ